MLENRSSKQVALKSLQRKTTVRPLQHTNYKNRSSFITLKVRAVLKRSGVSTQVIVISDTDTENNVFNNRPNKDENTTQPLKAKQ